MQTEPPANALEPPKKFHQQTLIAPEQPNVVYITQVLDRFQFFLEFGVESLQYQLGDNPRCGWTLRYAGV